MPYILQYTRADVETEIQDMGLSWIPGNAGELNFVVSTFVAKCFAHISDWRKSYARFEASGVAPVRRKNRTNPYATLEFDLNVGTNADRQAIVTVYLKPLVNGKDPLCAFS